MYGIHGLSFAHTEDDVNFVQQKIEEIAYPIMEANSNIK